MPEVHPVNSPRFYIPLLLYYVFILHFYTTFLYFIFILHFYTANTSYGHNSFLLSYMAVSLAMVFSNSNTCIFVSMYFFLPSELFYILSAFYNLLFNLTSSFLLICEISLTDILSLNIYFYRCLP